MTKFLFVFGLLLLAFSLNSFAQGTDLVGLWLFEDGDGDAVADSSGLGNEGEAIGDPKWVNGKFGGGLEFDGVDDIVLVPDSDALEFDGDFTLAVWIKTEATPPEPSAIITKGYHDQSNTMPWYLLYYRSAGTMTLYLRDVGRINSVADGTNPINDGEWHHVAAMVDGGDVKVYIDGNEDASVPLASETLYGGHDYPLAFMCHYDRYLAGTIDEVAIFKKALSEAELQQLMGGANSFLAVEPTSKLATSWGAVKYGE